jgi:hypothetical protein
LDDFAAGFFGAAFFRRPPKMLSQLSEYLLLAPTRVTLMTGESPVISNDVGEIERKKRVSSDAAK